MATATSQDRAEPGPRSGRRDRQRGTGLHLLEPEQRDQPLASTRRQPHQYVLQLGFLDGAHGLLLCAFAAAQVFLKYAELCQRSRAGRGG